MKVVVHSEADLEKEENGNPDNDPELKSFILDIGGDKYIDQHNKTYQESAGDRFLKYQAFILPGIWMLNGYHFFIIDVFFDSSRQPQVSPNLQRHAIVS
jgi:hypothetical protein